MTRAPRADRVIAVVAVLLGLAWLAGAALSLGRENINWDELGLLARAVQAVRTHELIGGGRPGLATLVLMPFASGCHDALATVNQARLFWLIFVLLYLGGIVAVVRELRERDGDAPAWRAPMLAVALVVLAPFFPRWGLQVRSDQPSIAFALWGTWALLASQRRPWLAAAAGLGFGIGYLFSQKAIYVAALAALLLGGQALVQQALVLRRELFRVALCALTTAAVPLLFNALVGLYLTRQAVTSVDAGLENQNFYRGILGLRVYQAMLPGLLAHGLVVALLLARSLRPGPAWRRLLVAWAVLGLGVGVALFHGSRFPYFWITLAVFPAITAGLALERALTLVSRPIQHLVVVGLLAILLVKGAPALLDVTRDTQAVQRRSLAFIDAAFAADDRGFHPESALTCRADPAPFPTFFVVNIRARFFGPAGQSNSKAFVDEFRARPVKFLVQSFRLDEFPVPVQRFWNDAYVGYSGAVAVPGRTLFGKAGTRLRFEAVTAGAYRLYLFDAVPGARIRLDDTDLGAGDRIDVARGEHRIELLGDVRTGGLALELSTPPTLDMEPFFSLIAQRELSGGRDW